MKGLDLFKEHFSNYRDSYVLIGGVATYLVLNDVNLEARATRDFDIVLRIEGLDKDFVKDFWAFIEKGKYQIRGKLTGEHQYYRFKNPETEGYPDILELFSRIPDILSLSEGAHLTPIPTDEGLSSLSAIILDRDYYEFLHSGVMDFEGLSIVGAEYLIPLKAKAWLNNTDRFEKGEDVKSKDIRKHKNDVFRLHQILDPEFDVEVPESIKDDLGEFCSRMEKEKINLKALGLDKFDKKTVLQDIREIYNLD